MINKFHGLSPSGGLVSPSGGFALFFFDQVEYFASIKLCQAIGRQGAKIESHYSHMYSSTLHDPILPHVQFHWEYALGCLATCTVPANMHDPIFPHVQFQFHQEYELASHGSCAVDNLSRGGKIKEFPNKIKEFSIIGMSHKIE